MNKGNLYGAIPTQLPEEFFQVLAAGKGTRIERIVSKGHRSPPGFWYDQPESEWVVVLQGRAALRFEKDGRLLELAAGDYVDIPPHEKHRVEWTAEDAETVWLAVFY